MLKVTIMRTIAAITFLACVSCGDPLAPTSDTRPDSRPDTRPDNRTAVTLTVRVLEYIDQTTPIPGVDVYIDGEHRGRTAADGALIVAAPLGREIAVRVAYPYYNDESSATAALSGPGEVWSFWLREY